MMNGMEVNEDNCGYIFPPFCQSQDYVLHTQGFTTGGKMEGNPLPPPHKKKKQFILATAKGSFINDVTVLGGGRQGFCDDSSKALVIKPVTMGGQKLSKTA